MFEKNDHFGHEPRQPAGRGKIARLPDGIREQLNQRLLDGQPASLILPWLNGLAPVKDALAVHLVGEPVTAQNLSNWRVGGYQHWLRHQKDLCQIKKFGDYAASLSPTRREHIAAGTAAMASACIFQSLKSTVNEPLSPGDVAKIAYAARSLVAAGK
jgi:hypothetical protein